MMPKPNSFKVVPKIIVTLLLVVLSAPLSRVDGSLVQRKAGTAEQRTARYYESLRSRPPQLFAFLRRMPKGGDLHNHLSGGIYAENYVQWAADAGLCVNQTTLAFATCDQSANQVAASTALMNAVLYRQLIDALSMRNWELSGQSGHDHFFDAFAKFGAVSFSKTGAMIAESATRAARGHVRYLELMFTTDGGLASRIGNQVGWQGNAEQTLAKLKEAGIGDAPVQSKKNLAAAEQEKDRLLRCGTAEADPGCGVTIRYIYSVSRASALGPVFAQMVAGLMMASEAESKVVGLNLVQGEDSLSSMQNFTTQMRMLDFLHRSYPNAHIALHAGELAAGLVPPEGLSFHIRQSVQLGHAERIGHGVDIMHEEDAEALLREMAHRNVMVEICLTSNDVILGVRGKHHPLATYLQYGVPVALATDDEGVSRSEMSQEFMKGAEEQDLSYVQLKAMARNSLEYAFIPSRSLWLDAKKFVPVPQCAGEIHPGMRPSQSCQQFLSTSEKARLQWELEQDFSAFESRY
jgi:adenosine deaminase/adenosine deaminase CECR1